MCARAPRSVTCGATTAATTPPRLRSSALPPARSGPRSRPRAAAAAIFGLAAGAIGTAIADSRRRDYYRQDYYYGGDPYYGRPYYGGPAYYGGYRYYPY